MASNNLPTRTNTNATDDAIPDEDTSEVTKLFLERLQAWKHACGYLEDYITSTEKMQHAHAKEYEKVLKTVTHPLKEGHHFDQSLGGVAGMFDNIRSNTQAISNTHAETAKAIKGSVLPVLERLHAEIKNKNKELAKGAGKGSKLVDKARAQSQKHIELLGQHTASFESTGGRVSAHEDPYILQRGVHHRLNQQIMEENNNRNDLIAVQNSFAQFEAHVLGTMQNAIGQFNQVVGNQAEQTRLVYGNIASNAQNIAPDFEWNGFVKRNNALLIDPSAPPRSIENVSFPNQNHKSTQPLLAGSLERKGKLLKKSEAAFWVITPSKYMHEFKTDDDFAKDPTPETSLYIPDCVVGGIDGNKFNIKGKDTSKSSIANKLSMNHEYALRAHTAQDAQKWWETLRGAAGQVTNELPAASAPTSPTSPSDTANSPMSSEKFASNQAYPERTAAPAASSAVPESSANQGYPVSATEKEAAYAASQGDRNY